MRGGVAGAFAVQHELPGGGRLSRFGDLSPRCVTPMKPDAIAVAARPESESSPQFLAGGGELGARMRAYDWAGTSLGPAEHWPRSLKTAVRIMLTSRQPIWIGWGRE